MSKNLKIFVPATFDGAYNLTLDLSVLTETDRDAVVRLHNQLVEKFGGYHQVWLSAPSRPRTTGYRSQSARIRGSCGAIAFQAQDKRWTAETVYALMKGLAVKENLWPYLEYRGERVPISEAMATIEDDNNLIKVINKFSDENNFWLYEYDEHDGKQCVYKSLGGRSLEEMQRLYPELNKRIQYVPEYGGEDEEGR